MHEGGKEGRRKPRERPRERPAGRETQPLAINVDTVLWSEGIINEGRFNEGIIDINAAGRAGINTRLNTAPLEYGTWQWIMGRLILLERLLTQLPLDFSLETKTAQANYQRLMVIIDFTFQQLGSTHINISKLAKKVFVLAAKNTAVDSTRSNFL